MDPCKIILKSVVWRWAVEMPPEHSRSHLLAETVSGAGDEAMRVGGSGHRFEESVPLGNIRGEEGAHRPQVRPSGGSWAAT